MEEDNHQVLIGAMFAWMNDGIERDALSEDGFRRFFTEDAQFVVNGNLRGIGPAALYDFFSRQVKVDGGAVMQWPLLSSFSAEDHVFVDYDMAIGPHGAAVTYNAKGYARIEGERIAHYTVNTFARAA